jgi:hypothetical protein
MTTLNELKYAALLGAGAVGSTLNELEINWLKDIRGRAGSTLNELWHSEFLAEGAAATTWNGMAYEYLGLQGALARTLNERWYQFWASGGSGGATPIYNTDAVAALWTPRGANTVTDASDWVEITYVDNTEGAYLRLSTTTILSEALVDGTVYRIVFQSKTAGSYYLGLTSNPQLTPMRAGFNVADFKPLGSTDLAASFLNISLLAGAGQAEAINHVVGVWKLP